MCDQTHAEALPATAARLEVALWCGHFNAFPYNLGQLLILWWAHQDSNLEPRDYESPALTD